MELYHRLLALPEEIHSLILEWYKRLYLFKQITHKKEKLLKQCVMLTYQMLLACSSIMSNRDIDYVNSNLQNVSKSIKEEIYDNGLRNIIEWMSG
jgi:hypothetical protein